MVDYSYLLGGMVLTAFLPMISAFFSFLPKLSQIRKGTGVVTQANLATARNVVGSIKSKECVSLEVFFMYITLSALSTYAFSFLFKVFTYKLSLVATELFFTFTALFTFSSLTIFTLIKFYKATRVNLGEQVQYSALGFTSLLLVFTSAAAGGLERSFDILDSVLILAFQVVLYFCFLRNIERRDFSDAFEFRVLSCTRMALNASFISLILISSNLFLKNEFFIALLLSVLFIEVFMNVVKFESVEIKSHYINKNIDKIIVSFLTVVLALKVI